MIAYRVFRKSKNGLPMTLFHGVNGKRELKLDDWLLANKRWVTNPGKKGEGRRFRAGFHVVPTLDEIVDYLRRFKHPEELVVCKVGVPSTRPKPGSKVLLADRMFIPTDFWSEACSSTTKSS